MTRRSPAELSSAGDVTMAAWNAMKRPLWTAFGILSRFNLAMNGHRYRYVFILGHMRSGSTLLAHILASHPEIVGAGETHLSYRVPADLARLVRKTSELLHRPFLSETYVVDQINHEYVSDEVLSSSQVYRCIILVRQADATLKSMMKLSIWSEDDAVNAYTQRLSELTRCALLLRSRAIFVDYDELIERTDETLERLAKFLTLRSPLTHAYDTHRMTGRIAGYGDPSQNIKMGRIIRTPGHDIKISHPSLMTAEQAYQNCHSEIRALTT